MTDYTARNVLLKDSSGNYLIPYTEKADLSLGNLNSAGKAYVAIKGYNSTATYFLNEVVMTVVSGSVLFYRSLADNNTASLSDTTKWSEVSFGSGANIDLSNLSSTGNDKFVTKDTAQTITGAKSFTAGTPLALKDTSLTSNSTNATSWHSRSIEFNANDNSLVGLVQSYQTTGNYSIRLSAKRKINGSDVVSDLTNTILDDGTCYVSCHAPNDTTSTSSNKVATTGWVNSTGNNLVHIDSTETVTGIKTFNASFSLNNTVVAGPGIKFAASGVEKADLFWRDGYGFTMTTANGANYELLRVKDPTSTDKGQYAATTSWCRDSTLGAPDYSSATEFANQSNYTTKLPYSAPKNGWIDLTVAAGSMITAAVNGRNVGGVTGNDGSNHAHILYRVKKGDVITRVNSSGTWGISFIPNANV